MSTIVPHWELLNANYITYIGTGKEGNLCEIFYYLVDFFHGLMDMGVVDFMNKNKKKSAKA